MSAKRKRGQPMLKQKNFRLSKEEAKGVERAALSAGVSESEWLRLIVRAALGDRTLLDQLIQVAPRRSSR